ncbi:MAG: hypothetical protein V4671_23890 [Armatimonadota bacterium]
MMVRQRKESHEIKEKMSTRTEVADPISSYIAELLKKEASDLSDTERLLLETDKEVTEARMASESWLVSHEHGVADKKEIQLLNEILSNSMISERRRELAWLACQHDIDERRGSGYIKMRICPECGTPFTPSRRGQIYDKRLCADKVGQRRRRREKQSSKSH